MTAGADLVGAWSLESFEDLHEQPDGAVTRHEGPLGPVPSGLLLYSADGHVSVAMSGTSYMSYAGSWRREHGPERECVVHTIAVAPDPSWIGSEQVRDLRWTGDRLVLTGHGPSGSPIRRELTWRRAA